MNKSIKTPRKRSERGTALLIAIFSLVLISAVALGLVVMAGTESSIDANYKSATQVFYNAKAGLEEARGRLWGQSPNPLTASGFPATNVPLLPGQVWYIINPAAAEVVDPKTATSTYGDTQYAKEWPATPAVVQPYINSVASLAGTPNAPYKWVRITAATEKSTNLDVNGDGVLDPTNAPLLFDGTQLLLAVPGTLSPAAPPVNRPPATANPTLQVYTITALAVTPSGGQRIEEYLTAATQTNLNFPAALTLAGNIGNFNGANSNQYYMDGRDGQGNPPAVPGCNPNQAAKPAIAVSPGTSPNNQQIVTNALPRPSHYITQDPITGQTETGSQAVGAVATNPTLSSPSQLNNLLQTLKQNSDASVAPSTPGGTYTFGGTGWPSDMSATNPKTVFVDGDFDLGPNTGYGILVVTGNFLYHGNSGWNGIILVVGDGTTTFDGQGGGNGQFDGAIYVATIKDANGNLLPTLGSVNFDISGGGGNGIYYNSCWINRVQRPPTFQVLSFKEIAQ